MENARLEDVAGQLQEEEERLTQLLEEARNQVAVLEADLKRVQGALKALGVAKKSGRGVPKNPAATREEVAEHIREILAQNSEVPEDDLKALVADNLTQAGRSKTGFALRYKEALKEFDTSAGKVRLPTIEKTG